MPDEMSIILSNELSNVAAQTTLDLQGLIASMRTSGMSDSAIKATLMSDLTSGGRLFGNYRNGVKNTVKSGIGRAGNIASEGRFFSAGVNEFQWVTASSKPCPDCERRHGETGTMEYWRTAGKPRSGFSVCQSSCQCQLLPVGYNGENLEKPLVRGKKKSITKNNLTITGGNKANIGAISQSVNKFNRIAPEGTEVIFKKSSPHDTILAKRMGHYSRSTGNITLFDDALKRNQGNDPGGFLHRIENKKRLAAKKTKLEETIRFVKENNQVDLLPFYEKQLNAVVAELNDPWRSNVLGSNQVQSVFNHEFGHLLDRTGRITEASKKLGIKSFDGSIYISDYALESQGEFMAEAFAAYMEGEKIKGLENLWQVFDEILK